MEAAAAECDRRGLLFVEVGAVAAPAGLGVEDGDAVLDGADGEQLRRRGVAGVGRACAN